VRGLRVTVLEDKIVQRATAEVMSAIYEEDFLGFSYGFRPGRSPHDALDALYAGIMVKPVSWGLETDIRGYFDAMDHGWLVRFVERRIADQRVVRHIKKWLHRICGKGCGQSSKRSKENSGGGMQNPVPAVGQWLRTVLLGQYRYYRVESNGRNLGAFRNQITQLRYRTFRRRSQRHQLTRERMTRFENRWLPLPRIVHSYLDFRQYVTI